MAVAKKHRRAIAECLNNFPKDWPFEDRVLAWLVPGLEREIVHFHAKNGQSMEKVFRPHQIAHLDKDLRGQLYARIRSLRSLKAAQLFDPD